MLMVLPSKHNLLRDAQPLEAMRGNANIHTLIVPRTIKDLFMKALREKQIKLVPEVEFTDHEVGVFITLNYEREFIGSYLAADGHQRKLNFSAEPNPHESSSPC